MAAETAAHELDRAWEELRDGINGAYESRTMSSETYMALYTHVYNYCSDTHRPGSLAPTRGGVRTRAATAAAQQNIASQGPNGQVLYYRIRDLIRARLELLVEGAVDKNGEDLINFYLEQWETYTFGSKVTDGFCAYLNRHWVKREHDEGRHDIHQVYQLGMGIWKEAILEPLQEPMVTFILQLITRARNGEAVDTGLIKRMTESLAELGKDWDAPMRRNEGCHRHKQAEDDGLGIYREGFEDGMIAETEDYYAQESVAFFQAERSVCDFMIRVEQRLNEEVERVRICLHPSSLDRLMKTCETVLIERHLPNFRDTFPSLLKEERKEDMRRLYGLVSRVTEDFTDMTAILQAHITSEGRDQIAQNKKQCAKEPSEYVGTVMAVYRKFRELALSEFQQDPGFMAALDRGCEAFINENALTLNAGAIHKSPVILSRYCDSLLKKGGKNHDDQELEELLNQAMIIFKFIEDKDVFQKYYTKLLANRLVGGLSSSDDMEASMITKLKAACGYEYTTKLHRMFLDIGLSKDGVEGFKTWLVGEGQALATPMTVDFSAMVLQSGSWPFTLDMADFALPEELVSCVNNFALYHAGKHEGRKLNWLYSKSYGEVLAHCFGQKTYTFTMSTYAMSILLQYNSRDSYKIQELAEASQLAEDVVIQVVQQFMKAHLLRSDDPQDQLTSSSVIYLFLEYNNKRLKVNLTAPLKMEVKEEVVQVEKAIEKQREFEIKAAIVRVMKTRKELGHQQLIGEVISQIKSRFSPSVALIKKCIEELILAEYLRRKEGERTVYQYIS